MRGSKEKKRTLGGEEEAEQISFLDAGEGEADWKKEWVGMPEFVQEDQEPFEFIKVCFICEEDRKKFAKLIGQNVTEKTKTIWYPKLTERRGMDVNRVYVDEP